jgi:hypothetical protein
MNLKGGFEVGALAFSLHPDIKKIIEIRMMYIIRFISFYSFIGVSWSG